MVDETEVSEAEILSKLREFGVKSSALSAILQSPTNSELAIPGLVEVMSWRLSPLPLHIISGLLATPLARPHWSELKDGYIAAASTRPKWHVDQFAAVLSRLATGVRLDDLLELIADARLGESRVLLLAPAFKYSNVREAGSGIRLLERLLDDPQLATEARVMLKRARRRTQQVSP